MEISVRLFVVALFLICGSAEATVRKTALTVELVSLGRFMQIYHDQEGVYPQSWDELERENPNLDKTFPALMPTRRIFLISPPIELPRRYSGGGLAIAMTKDSYRPVSWKQWPILGTPRQILKEPVYGVIVTINGGVSRREVPPEAMSSIFKAEGLALPEPSGLGAFPHEKKFMRRRFSNWLPVAALGVWLVWRLICGRKKHGASQKPNL